MADPGMVIVSEPSTGGSTSSSAGAASMSFKEVLVSSFFPSDTAANVAAERAAAAAALGQPEAPVIAPYNPLGRANAAVAGAVKEENQMAKDLQEVGQIRQQKPGMRIDVSGILDACMERMKSSDWREQSEALALVEEVLYSTDHALYAPCLCEYVLFCESAFRVPLVGQALWIASRLVQHI